MRNPTRIALSFALAALVLLLGAPRPTAAAGHQSGHAVAVSADGSQLVAGGSNRALYDLDPTTLEVKRRAPFGRQVMAMAFSPDGKTLIVESTKAIQWVKYDTLEAFETLEGAKGLSLAPAAGLVAVNSPRNPAVIRVLGMSDASKKADLPFDSTKSVAGFGLSPDGKKLALLYYRRKEPDEPKVAWKDIPEELTKKRGPKLREYQQHHDGYSSTYYVFDVATGKTLLEKKFWYGAPSGGNDLYWHGDDVYLVGYDNQNLKIDPQGEIEYFELSNSYNYARAASADGSVFLAGGLRDGIRTKTEGLEATAFRIDKMPGFPEYYKAFSMADDGTAFAGTTAFRVVRIGPDGKLVKVAPVY